MNFGVILVLISRYPSRICACSLPIINPREISHRIGKILESLLSDVIITQFGDGVIGCESMSAVSPR